MSVNLALSTQDTDHVEYEGRSPIHYSIVVLTLKEPFLVNGTTGELPTLYLSVADLRLRYWVHDTRSSSTSWYSGALRHSLL